MAGDYTPRVGDRVRVVLEGEPDTCEAQFLDASDDQEG